MSSRTTAFALDQKALDPIDQLALIIISDSCTENFTFEESQDALLKHSCLSEKERVGAFNSLSKQDLICLSEVPHFGNPIYFILVQYD